MIKVVALLRRAPGADWFEFRTYFRGDFLKGVLATAAGGAITRIVTNYVTERDFRPTTNADNHVWSALAEYYFDSAEDAVRTIRDPAFLAASAARPDMVAEVSHSVFQETLVYDKSPRPGAPKVYGFFRITLPRDNPVTRQQLKQRWDEHVGHMNDANYDKLLERMVQNVALPGVHAADPRYDYDGFSLVWFDSVEAGERIYKDYDVELAATESQLVMGAETPNCMYLRTDEEESYIRK